MRKALTLFVLTVVFGSGWLSFLNPAPTAQAATDNTHYAVTIIDRFHIALQGTDQIFQTSTGSLSSGLNSSNGVEYDRQNYDHGKCAVDKIFLVGSPDNAQYYTYTNTPTNLNCIATAHTNVAVTQASNFNVAFMWVASDTIKTVDGAKTYKLDTTTPTSGPNSGNYIQTENNSCKDYINPGTVGSPNGTLVYSSDNITNGGILSYKPYIDKNAKPTAGPFKSNGCTLVSWSIQIGNVGAAQKAPSNTADTSSSSEQSCEGTAGPLGWLVCGVVEAIDSSVQKVAGSIKDLLQTKPLSSNSGNGIYTAWTGIRGFANALLILVFLAIIFGQTFGVDAYTVKKALPRIVAAAILIQFSFLICSLGVDITNILGIGVDKVVTFAGNGSFKLSGWFEGGVITGAAIGLAGLVASIGSGTILIAAIGIIIALIGAFLTLAFRQLAIVILVVLSPLALLCWVLPNTEKLFKMWSSNFVKLLAMFPLIALIFAASDWAAKNLALGHGATSDLLGLALLVAPLFAVPWTFKWAGSIMAAGTNGIAHLAGRANKSFGTQSEWAQKYRKNVAQQRQQTAFRRTQSSSALVRAYGRAGAMGLPGLTKGGLSRGMRRRINAQMAGGAENAIQEEQKEYAQMFTQSNPSNDDLRAMAMIVSNPAQSRAALQLLQTRNQYDQIETVRQQLATEHDRAHAAGDQQAERRIESIWNNALDQAALREKAGDMAQTGVGGLNPTTGAYESMAAGSPDYDRKMAEYARRMSARNIINAHKTTLDRLYNTGAINQVQNSTWNQVLDSREAENMSADVLGRIFSYAGHNAAVTSHLTPTIAATLDPTTGRVTDPGEARFR